MTKMRAICKRCHRIRAIKEAGYCESCLEVLRAAERPKHRLSETPPASVVSTPRDPSSPEQPVVSEGSMKHEDSKS
jgi:hypothetical protein